jgi:hypothetical protein
MRDRLIGLLALLLTLQSPPIAGATLAGVTFPDRIEIDGHSLVLNGLGVRKKLFIKVYVGTLYLPQKEASAPNVLGADSLRRMVFHFLYGVSKGQMCDAWEKGLRDNIPAPSSQVTENFTQLCAWMEEIPKGHEMTLTYAPGHGTDVEVNGKHKGILAGKPTTDAIMSTWIGANPDPGQDFKKAVLGIP